MSKGIEVSTEHEVFTSFLLDCKVKARIPTTELTSFDPKNVGTNLHIFARKAADSPNIHTHTVHTRTETTLTKNMVLYDRKQDTTNYIIFVYRVRLS